jgi:sugar phosphate isomerase/epimerase
MSGKGSLAIPRTHAGNNLWEHISVDTIADLSRLCVHTMTTKPLSLAQACSAYAARGVAGITVWRQHLAPQGVAESARILCDSGLRVVSLCRGGFFPAGDEQGRQAAIEDNMRAVDEAAGIGAPLIVLVCGAVPGMPLNEARAWIAEGISAVAPHARKAGVSLAIEPLHPMYADSRSAVNTMQQANDMVEALALDNVGVAVDVYHLWWDPNLESEIRRAGDTIRAFHVCDWRTPTRDLLNDRALMGDGCVPVRRIRQWVEETGFSGPIEVEIFSDEWWATDQSEFLDRICRAYLEHV